MKNMFVYVSTNERRTTLYIGVTNNLERRLLQHRDGAVAFTKRYHLTVLIYFEMYPEPAAAIAREKQLKGWTRAKKEALIATADPAWKDLAADWFRDSRDPSTPLRPPHRLRSAQDDRAGSIR